MYIIGSSSERNGSESSDIKVLTSPKAKPSVSESCARDIPVKQYVVNEVLINGQSYFQLNIWASKCCVCDTYL